MGTQAYSAVSANAQQAGMLQAYWCLICCVATACGAPLMWATAAEAAAAVAAWRGCFAQASPCLHGGVTLLLCPADAVPKAQEQIKETMVIAADIESFVKQTLGV